MIDLQNNSYRCRTSSSICKSWPRWHYV